MMPYNFYAASVPVFLVTQTRAKLAVLSRGARDKKS
jgi:hypothetical protein